MELVIKVNLKNSLVMKTILHNSRISFIIVLFIVLVDHASILAQSRLTEEIKEITTESDQPNNEAVPGTIITSGNFERIIIIRLKHQMDVLAGLNEAVKQEQIKNAVILSGIGSLTSYHLHAVSNTTFPSQNVYYKESKPTDLVSLSGYIFDGRVHAHMAVSDEDRALGGHLESGNLVFTFAIITVGILSDEMDVGRFDDKSWR